ncbi:hypothetical protein HanIR_Chr13g0661871 [Helianthus annuus]|nr:hypothetical protein HanIR_Chr13g0661871 [Helianthus annuus]
MKYGRYKLVSKPWFEGNQVCGGKYLNLNQSALVTRNPYNPRLDQNIKVEANVSVYLRMYIKKN